MIFLEFGFHNFLNAEPLLTTLRQRERQGGFRLILDSPAGIACRFNSGKLDLGMVPSVEYLRNKNQYRLLDHFVIASIGSVDTVLLIAKKELKNVGSVALDNHSLTSSMLTKILFHNRFSKKVRYEILSHDPEEQLKVSDAVMVIGDKAFSAKKRLSTKKVFDLSYEWFSQTGKPFVHAVLVVRKEIDIPKSLFEVLEETKARLKESIQDIVKNKSTSFDLTPAQCEDYLQNKICYVLNSNTLEGLNLFDKFYKKMDLKP